MRGFLVHYLKILLAISAIREMAGGIIRTTTDAAIKKIMARRSLPFEDCGNGVSFLKHEVRWVFNYVKTQALISPDPCDGNQDCILNVNDEKTYWANIFVNETLPVMSGSMLWEAKDESNQNLICFEVPVIITV
ncbi:uncharacterized protein Npc2f isoform X2 [Drosophila tropicalis]|uniref:uncharacterized protein Npc2f isoform X2 n=1 Tax=Drosophila tropicalis TaxID=46794 RepID=UPI0035ABA9B1